MSATSEWIGKSIAGGTIGRCDYDWAFDIQPYYNWVTSTWGTWNFGYQDAGDFAIRSLNGAWGAWWKKPTMINIYSYALAAKSHTPIGVIWNGIDDALERGSQSMSGNTYEERIENWETWLDTIDNQVSWIAGNVREGGLGFLKYDNNSVFVLATYGTYTKEIAGHTEYKIASTASNVMSLTELRYDGCWGVFYWRGRDALSSSINWITHDPGRSDVYAITNPQLGEVFGVATFSVIWEGHTSDIADTINSERTDFSVDGNHQIVYNTMFEMNSITSPYSNERPFYYPDHKIDDSTWIMTEYHDFTEEGLGDGGDATDSQDNYGDFDSNSDVIDTNDPSRYTIDAQDCGLCTVYKVPKETLKLFAKWLFSDSHDSSFWDWIEKVKKIWDNPMDCIMSLNMAFYDANTGGEKSISFFGKDSGYTSPIVDGLVQFLDCGSLNTSDGAIHEFSGNFLDYGAKSTVKIYVPFCGTYSIATNEVMGGKLSLVYTIDLLTGACVAELKITRTRSYVTKDPNLEAVLYRFHGNIFYSVPIGASNYSQVIQGQLGLVASAMSAITGNVGGAIAGAVNSALSMSPQVERVGSLSSNYGYLASPKPYIIQEYPWYNWNDRYNNFYGTPSYTFGKLSNYHGFTQIDTDTLWVDKFKMITSEEEQMLKDICSSGIYIDHSASYYNYEP